jgi:hypothetical protein
MGRDGWHMIFEGGALVHARNLPARFDVVVEYVLTGGAGLSHTRIARQVRQDVWRAMQRQRGFQPVVSVAVDGADLVIRAGGQVDGPFSRARAEMIIFDVLHDPNRRVRWVNHARRTS